MATRRTLLAFDFDWSLLEENSDTFVIKELGADELYKASAGMPWTQRMDHVLLEAARQLGRAPADVTAALHRAPLHPALADLLRAAAAAGTGGGSASGVGSQEIDTIILSDANTVYIDVILEQHGLKPLVAEVLTNPAEWRDGALQVAPYHTHAHGCRHCPANLCKGQVLRALLERQSGAGRPYGRVLYVGDGRGDYCPSITLLHGDDSSSSPGGCSGQKPAAVSTPAAASGSSSGGSQPPASAAPPPCGSASNVVFAREEYPDGLPCSLWVMLCSEAAAHGSGEDGSSGEAQAAGMAAAAGAAAAAAGAGRRVGVVGWSRPEQLAKLLMRELQLE